MDVVVVEEEVVEEKKTEPNFEVVIDRKLSPAAAGDGTDYESFLEEKDSTAETEADVKVEGLAVEDEEEIVPDHYYGSGKIPVFKPVSTSEPSSIYGAIQSVWPER